MLKLILSKPRVLVSTLFSACAFVALGGTEACSSDPPADLAGGDAASDVTYNPDSPATDANGGNDAANEDAQITITDGGDILDFDPDAGLDDDAGSDAGSTCERLNPGAYHNTTCASSVPALNGGKLSTASYNLVAVTVMASDAFCRSSRYVVLEHRGQLVVTASSTTTANFKFVDLYRPPSDAGPVRPRQLRYDVNVVGGTLTNNTLAYTTDPTCTGTGAPTGANFDTGVRSSDGKKFILLDLPYGNTGTARYHFVEP